MSSQGSGQKPQGPAQKKGWVARGGLNAVLEIFKRLDPAHRDRLMKSVGERDPSLVEAIQKQWFGFEDLKSLSSRDLQKVLIQTPEAVLALALRNASPELLEKVYSHLPSRVREQMRDQVQALGPRRLSDVQEAQRKVIELGRQMGVIPNDR